MKHHIVVIKVPAEWSLEVVEMFKRHLEDAIWEKPRRTKRVAVPA